MTRRLEVTLLVAAVAAAGCDSPKLKCGEGTFRDGKNCVAYDPDDTTPPVTTIDPAVPRSREPLPENVLMTTDEPARIYFTVDGTAPSGTSPNEVSPVLVPDIEEGTVLRFFAVDASGNQEAERTFVFSQDITPPAAVGAFDLVVTGSDGELTWSNPTDADFTGVIVARVVAGLDAQPVDGVFYTAPASLSSSVQIVYAGTAEAHDDIGGAIAGLSRYAAWAYDDLGNYSYISTDYELSALGSLDAQLSIDTTTNVVTVVTQPGSFDLSATANYTMGTQTLTVDLTVTNESGITFVKPKVLVPTVSDGTFSDSTGSITAIPYKAYGPLALIPGASRTQTFTFTGVTAGTVTVDLTLRDDPLIIGTRRGRATGGSGVSLLDFTTGVADGTIGPSPEGRGPNGNGGYRHGVLSLERRFVFVGNNHQARIERIDLSTGAIVGGITMCDITEKCSVSAMLPLDGGRMLVAWRRGSFGSAGEGVVVTELIDDAVTRSVELPNFQSRNGKKMALSSDGSILAVPGHSAVAFLDMGSFTQIDVTPSTPEIDALELGISNTLRGVAFSNDDQLLFAVSRNSSTMAVVELANDYAVRYESNPVGGGARNLAVAADGRCWVATTNAEAVYDPVGDTFTASANYPHTSLQGIAELDGEIYILRSDRQTIDQVDGTGTIVRTLTTSSGIWGHDFSLSN